MRNRTLGGRGRSVERDAKNVEEEGKYGSAECGCSRRKGGCEEIFECIKLLTKWGNTVALSVAKESRAYKCSH